MHRDKNGNDTTDRNIPEDISFRSPDFIRSIVAEDLRTNKHDGRVVTR